MSGDENYLEVAQNLDLFQKRIDRPVLYDMMDVFMRMHQARRQCDL